MLVRLDLAHHAHHLPLVLPQLRGVHAGGALLDGGWTGTVEGWEDGGEWSGRKRRAPQGTGGTDGHCTCSSFMAGCAAVVWTASSATAKAAALCCAVLCDAMEEVRRS